MQRRDFIALAGLPLAAALAAPGAACAAARARRLLVLGDSLSAEYGLARGSGWVALLERRLAGRPPVVEVVNASVSGETTAGGASRIADLLARHAPTHVAIELGANDALRGLPVASSGANLQAILTRVASAGARALLIGMRMPPNYGRRYTEAWVALYADLAQRNKVPLVPFLLAGVADAPDARRWFQADGLHPMAEAEPRVLETVWSVLGPWLGS